ncbi:heat shock protein transcriptional repressor HspR [Corynebacterium mendelii]|uniref:MerR family transcriptional regulator n=1 Tax=Corynebacterium mendelii TaxID=2765362 RepID=A0A939E2F0_9CORY|nr:MerR family transcriptional regulator [Corynebacterium mendelii]MBN9645194.1 MerR family transcriptional regulator [Corynebacterium mendelii]
MPDRRHSHDDDIQGEVFVISVAAELAGMHAQTLRTYDRLGLVTPRRTRGGGRRYSRRDIDMLRTIQSLSQDEGVNLAGIKEILSLTRQNEKLRRDNEALLRENALLRAKLDNHGGTGELVHVPRSTAVVMWEPRRRRDSD